MIVNHINQGCLMTKSDNILQKASAALDCPVIKRSPVSSALFLIHLNYLLGRVSGVHLIIWSLHL